MTPPMTPREKVAAFLKERDEACGVIDADDAERDESAELILTALASGSGDHAELVLMANAALEIYSDDVLVVGGTRRIHADNIILYVKNGIEALLAENAALRAERDTAQSAVEAWAHVCESLEAHLQDRVAMQDVANPEQYLRILRSNIARVQKDSEQIRAARWADYRRHETRATEAERKLAEARLNYEGALSDIDSLLTVLIRRINGEKDLASAAEWVRPNYPLAAEKIISKEAERG